MVRKTAVVCVFLTVLYFQTGLASKLSEVFERLDDLELKLIKERIERRKELKHLHQDFVNVEGHLNVSNSKDLEKAVSISDLQFLQSKYEEMESKIDLTNTNEIVDLLQLLKLGFQGEKKQNVRLRRRVLQLENVLSLLLANSENSTTNTLRILKTLASVIQDLGRISDNVYAARVTLNGTAKRTTEMQDDLHRLSSDVGDGLHNLSNKILSSRNTLEEMADQNNRVEDILLNISAAVGCVPLLNSKFEEINKRIGNTFTYLRLQLPPQSCKQLPRSHSGVHEIFLENTAESIKVRFISCYYLCHDINFVSFNLRYLCRQIGCII